MKSSRILLALAASVLAVSAQAGGIQARDVPRIGNGSTGVIGGVEPGAHPHQPTSHVSGSYGAHAHASAAMAASGMPQAQAQSSWNDTSVMGAGRTQSSSGLAARHPAWGTPD